MKRYKQRVISKSDWISLRLLFMGSAVESSMSQVPDWNKCYMYFVSKYGMNIISKAFDLLRTDYIKSNEFEFSKLAWGQHINIAPEEEWGELNTMHFAKEWSKI